MTPAGCAGAGRRPLVGAEAPEALRAREQGDITALLSRFSFPSPGAGSGASQEAGRGRGFSRQPACLPAREELGRIRSGGRRYGQLRFGQATSETEGVKRE